MHVNVSESGRHTGATLPSWVMGRLMLAQSGGPTYGGGDVGRLMPATLSTGCGDCCINWLFTGGTTATFGWAASIKQSTKTHHQMSWQHHIRLLSSQNSNKIKFNIRNKYSKKNRCQGMWLPQNSIWICDQKPEWELCFQKKFSWLFHDQTDEKHDLLTQHIFQIQERRSWLEGLGDQMFASLHSEVQRHF